MTKTHIMLDLETWGKTPGSDIRSIGAVVFDPVAGITKHYEPNGLTFYIATDNPMDLQDHGYRQTYTVKYPLTRDPETVEWWDKQSPEAQAAFANPVDLREALELFHVWLEKVLTSDALIQSHEDQSLRLWANDPQFDVSILDAVYRAVGLPVPWHYRAPRSFRTVTELAGMTREEYSSYGEAHNALDDAIAQAMTVCEAYRRLGIQTP